MKPNDIQLALRKFLSACTIALALSLGFSTNLWAETQEDEVVRLLNLERQANRKKPLKVSPKLMAAAELHAQDMAKNGYFSHTDRSGSTVGKRVKRQGYKYCTVTENIVSGQKTAAAAMATWMGSKLHKKNNLNRKVREVGVGFAGSDIWVLVSAKPC